MAYYTRHFDCYVGIHIMHEDFNMCITLSYTKNYVFCSVNNAYMLYMLYIAMLYTY